MTEQLIEKLASANRVAVLTGAGMSAESGIATFRDPDGLWSRFRPEELANVDAFLANPVLVQSWYLHRSEVVRRSKPNRGHEALAEMEQWYSDFTVITQNVDNLHHRAGSRNVLELHGNLQRNYCVDCRSPAGDPDGLHLEEGQPFSCSMCGGLIRPDVVWFGEFLPEKVLLKAQAAAMRAEVFLSIGTSGLVFPAADLPIAAARNGAYTVEINVQRSAIAEYLDEHIEGKAGEVMVALCQEVKSARTGQSV